MTMRTMLLSKTPASLGCEVSCRAGCAAGQEFADRRQAMKPRTFARQMWRKRVGVEPTIRPAKDRIAGFEGRGDHRTPFASGGSITGEKSGFAAGIWRNWRCAWTCRSLRGARLAAQTLKPARLERNRRTG